MKMYVLLDDTRTIKKFGKSSEICSLLGVSRQALSKAVNNSTKCKGYFIEAYPIKKKVKHSKRYYCSKALELLKQARAIIDDENKKLIERGEYCHVNIIRRIDKLFNELLDKE